MSKDETWKDKVLSYYTLFESLSWREARDEFDPLSKNKDKWAEIFYHFYDSLTTKCAGFTETDGMCAYCWDAYEDIIENIEDGYYDNLEKKHLDYFMEITKDGINKGGNNG